MPSRLLITMLIFSKRIILLTFSVFYIGNSLERIQHYIEIKQEPKLTKNVPSSRVLASKWRSQCWIVVCSLLGWCSQGLPRCFFPCQVRRECWFWWVAFIFNSNGERIWLLYISWSHRPWKGIIFIYKIKPPFIADINYTFRAPLPFHCFVVSSRKASSIMMV